MNRKLFKQFINTTEQYPWIYYITKNGSNKFILNYIQNDEFLRSYYDIQAIHTSGCTLNNENPFYKYVFGTDYYVASYNISTDSVIQNNSYSNSLTSSLIIRTCGDYIFCLGIFRPLIGGKVEYLYIRAYSLLDDGSIEYHNELRLGEVYTSSADMCFAVKETDTGYQGLLCNNNEGFYGIFEYDISSDTFTFSNLSKPSSISYISNIEYIKSLDSFIIYGISESNGFIFTTQNGYSGTINYTFTKSSTSIVFPYSSFVYLDNLDVGLIVDYSNDSNIKDTWFIVRNISSNLNNIWTVEKIGENIVNANNSVSKSDFIKLFKINDNTVCLFKYDYTNFCFIKIKINNKNNVFNLSVLDMYSVLNTEIVLDSIAISV